MRANNGFGDTVAIRHEISQIGIYEVTETELSILESYSASDVFFDSAIAATSLFVTSLITIFTIDFTKLSQSVGIFFTSLCIATGLVMVVAWIAWGLTKKNKREIIDKIKERKAKTESASES